MNNVARPGCGPYSRTCQDCWVKQDRLFPHCSAFSIIPYLPYIFSTLLAMYLHSLINEYNVFSCITPVHFMSFFLLTEKLKQEILLAQPSTCSMDKPPDFLADYVVAFLSASCSIHEDDVQECWEGIRSALWNVNGDMGSFEWCQGLYSSMGCRHGLG